MQGFHRRGWRVLFLSLTTALLAASVQARAAEPGPGGSQKKSTLEPIGVVNSETWEQYKDLLPAEFLERYKNGEWEHEVYEIPEGTVLADLDFLAAGERNRGKYDIGKYGEVIDVKTGKQPQFIYGPPFPDIDPADPKAGIKCVWNFFYQSYLLGNSLNYVNLDFVGRRGMERRIVSDVYQKFYDGQPPKYLPKSNPQNFLFQQISGVVAPADLQGTVALSHRFRDPRKRDQQWTYVPALRRVRAVSPANRSDGFLGSDMSQDDGSYFDGKPEDFEWKLVGEGEVLMLYDRTALLEKKHNLRALPEGGRRESTTQGLVSSTSSKATAPRTASPGLRSSRNTSSSSGPSGSWRGNPRTPTTSTASSSSGSTSTAGGVRTTRSTTGGEKS
ncbi:MAG: hypothetical protein KatS3mg076_0528 [Candidatus Binatia bacterium]|nr:MAG: hypothetical protein KatS3mg076_0528 [Candidatus Binatia bacterium]